MNANMEAEGIMGRRCEWWMVNGEWWTGQPWIVNRETSIVNRETWNVKCQSSILNFKTLKNNLMFLQLNHQKLDVFTVARSFTNECYRFTTSLPPSEKFNMVQQVRRAALSVYLNIAEGCSRKSLTERRRFFEISRGSIIEIDAVLDLSTELNHS